MLPDYNRKATVYWWIVVVAGALLLLAQLRALLALPAGDLGVALSGVALAMLAALFPIRIPRWKSAFTAGEIFIFLLLLLQGPAAATLAAAADGLLGSWRTTKRWSSRLASPAMAGLAMYAVGSALTAGLQALREHGLDNAGVVLAATTASAVIYWIAGTLLMTTVLYLKRNARPTLDDLFGIFGWLGIAYAGSAAIACLLFLSARQSGLVVLMAAAPIIALLLATLHYHFRQREVDEAARQSRLDAAEREAKTAAAHVIELQASEQRFHNAFSHASIGMALVSFDGLVLQANAALCELLGFAHESELHDRSITEFIDAPAAATLLEQMRCLQDSRRASFAAEFALRHRSGEERWASVHGSRFLEVGSDTQRLILQVQDITARRRAEAGLQHIAFHDSLTGLPNRHRFQQVLGDTLMRAQGDGGKPFALMFLDFDRFKLINDSLGHAVGDEFLVAVAARIRRQLRPTDTVARLGGDEFAILAVDLDCERYATLLADRLLEALRQPFHIQGNELATSVSIGITFSGSGYTEPSDMLRDADTAMYKAKTSGKARYSLFDSALHTAVAHRMRLERDLRRALADGQIGVAYQPLFDLDDLRITGFEALVRWQHPELGSIEPTTLVPVAEEAGMMIGLTDFVLRTACRQLAAWQRRDARFAELDLHVNLSGIDVAHPNLEARVKATLAEAGVQPRHLTLELTENALMQRLEGALPALIRLRRSGVGVSVDDFGTGYSSLRHLSSLPVNELKLDRGFVADLERGASEQTVVRAIVMMGQSLGKLITAEGIETAEQLARLKQAGCRAGQGFLLSPPLAAEEVGQLLEGMPAEPAPPAPRDSAYARLH
ncbi:MAG: EAL domain-containing protein [Burkholderiaceae bacterium]|nr:EAL domain-containing protein [Burkholderiaceae bacterium]